MSRRIILAGATGLIGRSVATFLSESDCDLHIISRREEPSLPSKAACIVAAPEKWPALVEQLKPDIAVSCLGTTMRKAGSKEAFTAVDLDLVLSFAKAAKAGGARQMISVSSVGASKDSGNFYLKIKGQAEAGIQLLGFDRTDFMRPGLLRGDRGADRRFGERIGIFLSPLMDLMMMGPLSRYRSIAAQDVAKSIAGLTHAIGTGHFIHENIAIERLSS
jgi:uncharacterized protein YbjT (DUF2867 family)